MTCTIGQLKWEFLEKRRGVNRLLLLHKGLEDNARIPTNDLIPKIRRCINHGSTIAFQIPSANYINTYKYHPFLKLSGTGMASMISSAEVSDDCGSKFTSLLRARD